MTTTISSTTTTVPVKTDAQSWHIFTIAIKTAVEAEEARLIAEFPTPIITAELGSTEWNEQYFAQRRASDDRSEILSRFTAKLIVSVGEALASIVPNFDALRVEYEGSGDQGEGCTFDVDIRREPPTNTVVPFEGAKPTLAYTNQENQAWLQASSDALALLPDDLTEWLDETCWALAYSIHPGFEVDAGGFGTITVQRNADGVMKLTLTHADRVESVEEYAPQELA